MQTFLPYDNYEQSARVLDNRRLGKQRVECLQILNALKCGPYQMCVNFTFDNKPIWESCTREEYLNCVQNKQTVVRKTPWYNHTATQMWNGYEQCLVDYGMVICKEWKNKGFKDTCETKIFAFWLDFKHDYTIPPWMGNEKLHASHRSNLLKKDPKWYGQFGWTEPNDLPYVWPSKENL